MRSGYAWTMSPWHGASDALTAYYGIFINEKFHMSPINALLLPLPQQCHIVFLFFFLLDLNLFCILIGGFERGGGVKHYSYCLYALVSPPPPPPPQEVNTYFSLVGGGGGGLSAPFFS